MRSFTLLPLIMAALVALPLHASEDNEKEVRHAIDHVTVYRQGAQIKRTTTTVVPAGTATLVFPGLPTAIDPSQVRRKLEGHNNKTNPITGKRELQREWEITVHNRKTQPIRVVIDDQLPLSNDEDVIVKAEALGGGKLNKDTGRVEWDLIVKPGIQEDLKFRYSVQAPKEVPIRLDS